MRIVSWNAFSTNALLTLTPTYLYLVGTVSMPPTRPTTLTYLTYVHTLVINITLTYVSLDIRLRIYNLPASTPRFHPRDPVQLYTVYFWLDKSPTVGIYWLPPVMP